MPPEKMREEWIGNITHDLKTPLSPIKGYAEILQEPEDKSQQSCRRYAGIILKNFFYMETLIGNLKLIYELESGMLHKMVSCYLIGIIILTS